MKNILQLPPLLLVVLSSFLASAVVSIPAEASGEGKSHGSNKNKCKDEFVITAKDINNSSFGGCKGRGTIKGFVIDKPGIWRLCEDVEWHVSQFKANPLDEDYSYLAAISIEANDVVLELDDHTIRQINGEKYFKIIGSISGNKLTVTDSQLDGPGGLLSKGAQIRVKGQTSTIDIQDASSRANILGYEGEYVLTDDLGIIGSTTIKVRAPAPKATAIRIAEGVSNVTIQGGRLEHITAAGIWAEGKNNTIEIDGLTTINVAYLTPPINNRGLDNIRSNGAPFHAGVQTGAAVYLDGSSFKNKSDTSFLISEAVVKNCEFFNTGIAPGYTGATPPPIFNNDQWLASTANGANGYVTFSANLEAVGFEGLEANGNTARIKVTNIQAGFYIFQGSNFIIDRDPNGQPINPPLTLQVHTQITGDPGREGVYTFDLGAVKIGSKGTTVRGQVSPTLYPNLMSRASGVWAYVVSGLQVINNLFDGGAGSDRIFVIEIDTCSNSEIGNNVVMDCLAYQLIKGMWVGGSNNLLIHDDRFLNLSNNVGTSLFETSQPGNSGAEGIKAVACDNLIFRREVANGIKTTGIRPSTALPYGMLTYGFSADIASFEDSIVENVQNLADIQYNATTQWYTSGIRCSLKINRCTTRSINSVSGGQTYAFFVFSVTAGEITDCQAISVVGAGTRTSVEFLPYLTSGYVVTGPINIFNCLADRVLGTNVLPGIGINIAIPPSGVINKGNLGNNSITNCSHFGIWEQAADPNGLVSVFSNYAAFNGAGFSTNPPTGPSTNYNNLKAPDTPYQFWVVGQPPQAPTAGDLVNVDRNKIA